MNEILANCPKCGTLVLRKLRAELETKDSVAFSTVCSGCHTKLQVEIGAYVTVSPVIEQTNKK